MLITSLTNESFDVQWQAPEYTGGTPVTGYLLEIRETTRTFWRRVALLDSMTTSYTITNLREGYDYVIRVIARNREGESTPLLSETISVPKARSKNIKLCFKNYMSI